MDSYQLWRTLHVTSAVLLIGNVTVTGFWAYFLYRQRGSVGFRAIARGIMWSDVIFTLVGGAGLTITGILMVRAQQISIMDTPWLRRGVLALAVSTVVWLVSLLPDQVRMERLDQSDDRAMRRLFTRWSVLGWASTVLLFVGLWSMVMKR
jgi:uncharacterized membrane protein